MDFRDLILVRQSVRQYADRIVEKEKLDQCLEAARLAPSASNSQPWTFIVIRDPDLVAKVGEQARGPMGSFNNFVSKAPVIVAIVMEKMKVLTKIGAEMKDKEYPLIDIGIAAEHLCLQAAELGLGTCMLGWFNEKATRQLLNVPGSKRIVLLITIGYAPENYKLRTKIRKAREEVIRFDKYE
jgi:nitroreductase